MLEDIVYLLDLIATGLVKDLQNRPGDEVTRRELRAYDCSLVWYQKYIDASMDMSNEEKAQAFKSWLQETEEGARIFSTAKKFCGEKVPVRYDSEALKILQGALNKIAELQNRSQPDPPEAVPPESDPDINNGK